MASHPPRRPLSQSICLLVVEDEALLRTLLAEGLEAAGFELVFAPDGQSAVQELDSHAASFQAVLTDVKLGSGPSGWEVARHCRELIPQMPIIYMTGDSAVFWPSQGVPGSVLVQKPYVIAQIVTAVTMLLNATEPQQL